MLKLFRRSLANTALFSVAASAVLLVQACSSAATQDIVGATNPGADIVRLSVVPRSAHLLVGDSLAVATYGHLQNGDSTVVPAAWSSTAGSISGSGWFHADVGGALTVRAVSIAQPALSDSAAFEVATVELTPADTVVSTGGSVQVSPRVVLPDGSVTIPMVTWTVTGGTISAAGVYSAPADSGIYQISAQVTGHAASASLRMRVKPATLLAFVLNPSAVSLLAGATQQFSLAALWSNGSSVVPAVAWSATSGTVSSTGLYTAGQTAGTFRVIATATTNGRADTSDVIISVPAPTLMQLGLSPKSVTLMPSGAQQYAASGTWSDGSSTAPAVTYSATGGTISETGLYMAAMTPGTFRVIASQTGGTKADTATVTISVPVATLLVLVLNPKSLTLAPGGAQQFSVAGAWSDGSSAVPVVAYVATGGVITTAGLYTAGATPGTFRVIATQQGGTKADTSTLTVVVPPSTLTKLTVAPKSLTLVSGGAQQFVVTGSWSDGSSTVPAATYAATGGTITANGLYTAGTIPGAFHVIATQQGGTLADTATVTIPVPPPTLTTLVLNPKSLVLQFGAPQQFSVAGSWSDGAATVPTVSYSAAGGTITTGGLYTAGTTAGTFRVVATQQGGTKADTSVVTVTAPTLSALVLNPSSVTLLSSATQQFSVAASWSDGSTTVPPLTWSATGGTVTTSGLYTAGTTAGTYRVIAKQTVGGKADTSTVVVTLPAPTLTKLTIAPKSVTVNTGATKQFTVTALWSDGSTAVPVTTFSATGGTITMSGTYTAGSTPGTYWVIATQLGGGRADTAVLTISSAQFRSGRFFSDASPFNTTGAGIGATTAITGSGQQFARRPVGLSTWIDGGQNRPIYYATVNSPRIPVRFSFQAWQQVYTGQIARWGNTPQQVSGLRAAASDTFWLDDHGYNYYSTNPAPNSFNPRVLTTTPLEIYVPEAARPSPDIDGHLAIVQPDGRVWEGYSVVVLSDGSLVVANYNFSDPNGIGDGSQNGVTASMIPNYAGVLTDRDVERVQAGLPIDHAVSVIISRNFLRSFAPKSVYPALAYDKQSTDYSGNVPMGGRLAIPAPVDLDTLPHNWTLFGRALVKALQVFGAYVTDAGGDGMTFSVDGTATMRPLSPSSAWDPGLVSDFAEIASLLKLAPPP